ncbi:MAG: hypothetical protein U5L96_00565 [Owenweeksia sp.]|nr:hypothetical protein [Owenweeksia sp.]
MYQLDHPYYLYLLTLVPVIVLVYLVNWLWRRRTRIAFGDLPF